MNKRSGCRATVPVANGDIPPGIRRARRQIVGDWIALLLLFAATVVHAADTDAKNDWHRLLATGQMVEIQKVDPTILVEMRYAGPNNVVGHSIYPAGMPCMARREVAYGLQIAQYALRAQGYGLKVWDAYRPPEAQRALWKKFAVRHYVADPTDGRGSLHSWGLAVDVTLVDKDGHEVEMPSGFDNFTSAASAINANGDPVIHARLRRLQRIMKAGGFIALSTEWWHFALRAWKDSEPLHWD